jgi:integrase
MTEEIQIETKGTAEVAVPFCIRARTVTVTVRHSSTCPDRAKGGDWHRCRCSKSLLIYEGEGRGRSRRVSAKTRSWEQAEKQAAEIRDSWDPDKQELKLLRADKERRQVRVEEAVALFCADQVARLGEGGTVRMTRSMLGHINPVTKAVQSPGHLFPWLNGYNNGKPIDRRVIYIADFLPEHLSEWRASWNFGDLTASQRWTMVKGFFAFCESQGWIKDSPARKLKRLTVSKGNRTAIFTDEQHRAILDAVHLYDPDNVPEATRKAWQQRLTIFIELLRWSGMALVDAVQYRPDLVDHDGVLRYRRQKTGVLATVPLPEHVVTLLRDISLERDSVGPALPFRTKDADLSSDVRKMEHRLQALFELAGITEVQTEQGRVRNPHPHMWRDTFAVSALLNGAKLHTVSKMLGHSNTAITEKAYLPWCRELQEAHIADARKALANVVPKTSPSKKVVSIARTARGRS